MWILVHNIFVDPRVPNLNMLKTPQIQGSQIGNFRSTKMLCTKIYIYNQFPVDTNENQCRIGITNGVYLSSKNFHLATVVNLLVKLQIKLGTPKPWSISFFWSNSINTWSFSPESASGAKHFRLGVILGQPRAHSNCVWNCDCKLTNKLSFTSKTSIHLQKEHRVVFLFPKQQSPPS